MEGEFSELRLYGVLENSRKLAHSIDKGAPASSMLGELEIDTPPSEVTGCNCSICRRYGVLWAYYPPDQVRVLPSDPHTDVYVWNGRTTEFHRCQNCGCVSHWSPVDRERNRMGVNARLMEPESLAGARVRHLDGANTDEYID